MRCKVCKRSLDEENDCTNGLEFCQSHCPCSKAKDGLCHNAPSETSQYKRVVVG